MMTLSALKQIYGEAVIDFAENYSHQSRFEHQSKNFSQVQTTIVLVVMINLVEDFDNINQSEKDRLLQLFDELQLPRDVSQTHYIISSDMMHSNPFIQKPSSRRGSMITSPPM